MKDKSTEELVDALTKRVDDLENSQGFASNIRWDAVAVVAIWIAAAVMCFSPVAVGNLNEILGCAVVGTLIVAIFI